MSKITLTNLVNLQNETTAVGAINANNAALTTALDNTLSRDGTSPNQMGANLDMNSNRIINLPSAISTSEPVTLAQMSAAILPTGLTGVPVSAVMQPVVNSSTIAAAKVLLQIPTPYVDATLYGVVADGVTDDTTALQAAVNAAAGKMVQLPAGTIVLKNQVVRNTSVLFTPGLYLNGMGRGITIIDNQFGSAGCFRSSGNPNLFQRGLYIGNMTITSTTLPAASNGIDLYCVYGGVVENIDISNMTTGDGIRVTTLIGDSDASNNLQFRNCTFTNCSVGFNCAAIVVQTSLLRFDNCFWNACGNGLRWIGAAGMMIGGGFTECTSNALNIVNIGGSNDLFTAIGVSFENNLVSANINSLQGGSFIGCELAAGAAGTPVQTQAVILNNSSGVRWTDTRVRTSLTPHTLWTFTSATGNVIDNTYYQNYDSAGQTRYSVDNASYANRVDASADTITQGLTNGISSITCVNGSNENLTLPITGASFTLSGPTGAFSIGGFTNGFDGRRLTISNLTGQILTINSSDGSSSAANRIRTDNNANVTINPNGSFTIVYNKGLTNWFLVGKG